MSDKPVPPLGTVTSLPPDLEDYRRREMEDEDARREFDEAARDRRREKGDDLWRVWLRS